MKVVSSKTVSGSYSDNRKSAIQNPKWLGLSVIAFVLVLAGALSQAQQEKIVRRIGIRRSGSASSLNSLPSTRYFATRCANLGTWRERIC